MMGRKNDRFMVFTGNYISTNNVEKLKNHLELMKNMSKPELTKLYIQTLHRGPETIRGGAGLGLISAFRDSAETPEYLFTPIDNDTSFYALGITI